MTQSRELTTCLLCGSPELSPVIDLGNQPLSGVFPKVGESDPPKSPLELMQCNGTHRGSPCGNLQLRHAASVAEMYGHSYGYNSSLSPLMVNHLRGLAASCRELVTVGPGDIVLDIGCNDGTLLSQFAGEGVTLFGMDPSSQRFLERFPQGTHVICDFFSGSRAEEFLQGRKCKLITSIAMFYDLEFPQQFVDDVATLLTEDGLWVVEHSDLDLFLHNLTYDQICHEHLLYLGTAQMIRIAAGAGLHLAALTKSDINGGSARYFFTRTPSSYQPEMRTFTSDSYAAFTRRVQSQRDDLLHFIRLAKAAGHRLAGYGASTKGNVVLNYCGISGNDLEYIADLNPFKADRITPGTRIPIISHEAMRLNAPDYLIVLCWHFRKEVIEDEQAFLDNGGRLVFPLPRLHIVDRHNRARYLNSTFEDLAFMPM